MTKRKYVEPNTDLGRVVDALVKSEDSPVQEYVFVADLSGSGFPSRRTIYRKMANGVIKSTVKDGMLAALVSDGRLVFNTQADQNTDYYSRENVADLFHISIPTVHRWINWKVFNSETHRSLAGRPTHMIPSSEIDRIFEEYGDGLTSADPLITVTDAIFALHKSAAQIRYIIGSDRLKYKPTRVPELKIRSLKIPIVERTHVLLSYDDVQAAAETLRS